MEKYLLNIISKLKSHHRIVLFLPSKYHIHLNGVRIYHFHLPRVEGSLLKTLYYAPAFVSIILQLPKILIKEKIEVISTFIPTEASILIHLIGKLLGKKTILNLRGVYEKETRKTILTWDLTTLFSDQIIVNSRDFRERYSKQSYLPTSFLKGKKWAYIPNAINSAAWKPQNLEKKYDIIFVANIQDRQRIINKGFDILVKIISLANSEIEKTLKVGIIGQYNIKEIRRIVGPFEGRNYEFLGLIDNHQQLVSLLNQSNIFLLTSRTEGMPNSLMEAMALGMPCIATPVGAIPELIDDGINGILCSPKNPGDFVKAIIKIQNDEKFRIMLGSGANKKINNYFSWDHSIKAIELFYRR